LGLRTVSVFYDKHLATCVDWENPWDVVYLYECCVENSFEDRTVHRNIEKVVPEAMAVMQNRIANVLF